MIKRSQGDTNLNYLEQGGRDRVAIGFILLCGWLSNGLRSITDQFETERRELSVEGNPELLLFYLPSVIGSENSRYPFNQTDAKLKQKQSVS